MDKQFECLKKQIFNSNFLNLNIYNDYFYCPAISFIILYKLPCCEIYVYAQIKFENICIFAFNYLKLSSLHFFHMMPAFIAY